MFFHGSFDPWMPKVQQQYPWVKKFYRKAPATLLLLGTGSSVWEDVNKAHGLFTPDINFAINGTGTSWMHGLDHWIFDSDDGLLRQTERRRHNMLPRAGALYCTSKTHRVSIPMKIVDGVLAERAAIKLALELADKVILAGFNNEPRDQGWDIGTMKSKVRALSGPSVELFGVPDHTWLRAW